MLILYNYLLIIFRTTQNTDESHCGNYHDVMDFNRDTESLKYRPIWKRTKIIHPKVERNPAQRFDMMQLFNWFIKTKVRKCGIRPRIKAFPYFIYWMDSKMCQACTLLRFCNRCGQMDDAQRLTHSSISSFCHFPTLSVKWVTPIYILFGYYIQQLNSAEHLSILSMLSVHL